MTITVSVGGAPDPAGPQGACSSKRKTFLSPTEPQTADREPTTGLLRLPQHWAELQAAQGSGPIGSGWDAATAGPDTVLARHLAEWIDGSAVAPELAAANVQSLQGQAVLEALAGDRLEALGRHASQYATGPVARLLRSLEPLAEAGGWWCSGLDPLANWAPMPWGQLKPDRPRLAADGKLLKYEAPHGTPTRSIWLRVPAVVALRVADRFNLPLPPAVAADADGATGAFWHWWAKTPELPLLLTEGGKKAGALLSIGVPAVALPGIWNGCPKNREGRPELLADLAGVPLEGRPCWVLFDHSNRRQGRRDVRMAARRLGRKLAQAGADSVRVGAVPAGRHKGADDWLAAGRSWEELAQALEPLNAAAVLPWLRPADQVAAAGRWLGEACPVPSPELARLVALAAPMGAGKTEAIAAHLGPLMAAGVRVLLITHRRSLGAALAERLGLPWADLWLRLRLHRSRPRQRPPAAGPGPLHRQPLPRLRPADQAQRLARLHRRDG